MQKKHSPKTTTKTEMAKIRIPLNTKAQKLKNIIQHQTEYINYSLACYSFLFRCHISAECNFIDFFPNFSSFADWDMKQQQKKVCAYKNV